MGCLVAVGQRRAAAATGCAEVLAARDRDAAAPTFAPDGLYFVGPYYDAALRSARAHAGDRLAALTSRDHAAAHPHQDLRPDARGRRRRGGRRRRRRGRLRALRQEPAPRRRRARRASWRARLPPFVTPVLLFVNADGRRRRRGLRRACRSALLQFHGDETPAQCDARRAGPTCAPRAWRRGLRFARLRAPLSPDAQALLLDAHVEGYGGGGKVIRLVTRSTKRAPSARFVWWVDAANVIDGMLRVRPWAVDVSSGVESAKGIKDAALIRRFCDAVREADARIARRRST